MMETQRRYYLEQIKVNWRTIKREFIRLLQKPLCSKEDLEHLIFRSGEGAQILFDHGNKLFIKMKSKTNVWNYLRYLFFQKMVILKGLAYNNEWEKKIDQSPLKFQLNQEKYGHLLKIISHQQKMYVASNTPLIQKAEKLGSRYGLITSRLGEIVNGKKQTIPFLESLMRENDQEIRKSAFLSICRAYEGCENKLEGLFDQLVILRQEIAQNSGFANYRDYAHIAKGRFSYSVADVISFHSVVKEVVVPLSRAIHLNEACRFNLPTVMPWDIKLGQMLKAAPYAYAEDLMSKCRKLLYDIRPAYAEHFTDLFNQGLIDPLSRRGKSFGAYTIPLHEKRASFIFTNFVPGRASYHDIAILHHEFGHALHNYFTFGEQIMTYRNFPSEIAELAAMTMELIALEHLECYFADASMRKEAKKQQLKRFIHIIVNYCLGDAYQHWVYTNPGHSRSERREAYIQCMSHFDNGISWEGIENKCHLESLKVLHFFQIPFYYIEYAFAALGAIDLYLQYKSDPRLTLDRYETFLRSGYNKDVALLYKEAGTTFSFSGKRVRELMRFVKEELEIN